MQYKLVRKALSQSSLSNTYIKPTIITTRKKKKKKKKAIVDLMRRS